MATLAQISSLETIGLPANVDGSCVDDLLRLPNLRFVSLYRSGIDRPWSAKQLTKDDVQQFRRLAEVLFARLDKDADGVVTESDFSDLVTFAQLKYDEEEELELTNANELLEIMLYRCPLTQDARQELREPDGKSGAID